MLNKILFYHNNIYATGTIMDGLDLSETIICRQTKARSIPWAGWMDGKLLGLSASVLAGYLWNLALCHSPARKVESDDPRQGITLPISGHPNLVIIDLIIVTGGNMNKQRWNKSKAQTSHLVDVANGRGQGLGKLAWGNGPRAVQYNPIRPHSLVAPIIKCLHYQT